MSILTSGQSLIVCLVALCFIHITDTHTPPVRQRTIPVTNSGSVVTVRDILTADQLSSIQTRWAAQGLDPSRLESMLRSNSRNFIAQHNQGATAAASLGPRTDPRTSDPVQPRPGRSRLGRVSPRDPIGLRGSIRGDSRNGQLVNPNGLVGRNIERPGHEGHNHGSIGRNAGIIGQNRIASRDPIDLRGSIRGDRRNRQLVNPNGLVGRNIERPGHEGHNHGSIGRNADRIGQNRIASRGDRRNRRGRQPNGVGRGQRDMRIGVEERISPGELGRSGGEPDVGLEQRITPGELARSGGEPDVGLEERIPEAELQRLLGRGPNGVGVEGIATGGVRQERIRNRNDRQGRTRIDPLGRPIDMHRVLTNGIQSRGRNQHGRRIDGHEHGHGNEHVGNRQHRQFRLGNIHVDLLNRQRGGIERLDGTRAREGLNRLRARNNDVNVVPPPQRRRRRRRNGLARLLQSVVGTFLG